MSDLRHRLIGVIAVIILSVCTKPVADAGGWNIDTLMHELALRKGGAADFVETKTLAVLDRPVRSSGELLFAAPDFLQMTTLSPAPQTVTVSAGMMSIKIGQKVHYIQLDEHPKIEGFIEAIRATLTGNRALLEHFYAPALIGSEAQWRLDLVPRDQAMLAEIREIVIDGSGNRIRHILIRKTNHDQSLITVQNTATP